MVAALTVKALASDRASLPVATVIVRTPNEAFAAIEICAVKLVAFVTFTELTVIPGPKLTWLTPCAKCVLCPEITTGRLC